MYCRNYDKSTYLDVSLTATLIFSRKKKDINTKST